MRRVGQRATLQGFGSPAVAASGSCNVVTSTPRHRVDGAEDKLRTDCSVVGRSVAYSSFERREERREKRSSATPSSLKLVRWSDQPANASVGRERFQ